MATNVHVRVPIPGLAGGIWAREVDDPDGLGRGGAFYPVVEATIDVSTFAAQLALATPIDIELLDVVGGVSTKFYRRMLFDTSGAFIGTADYDATGAAYTATGSVTNKSERVSVGNQTLAFDATIATLTPTTGANWAEIHVWDGDMIFDSSGSNPNEALKAGTRVMDGGYVELESEDEIADFKCLGLSGSTGTLYIVYFIVP